MVEEALPCSLVTPRTPPSCLPPCCFNQANQFGKNFFWQILESLDLCPVYLILKETYRLKKENCCWMSNQQICLSPHLDRMMWGSWFFLYSLLWFAEKFQICDNLFFHVFLQIIHSCSFLRLFPTQLCPVPRNNRKPLQFSSMTLDLVFFLWMTTTKYIAGRDVRYFLTNIFLCSF
jgi:hypothetical protein